MTLPDRSLAMWARVRLPTIRCIPSAGPASLRFRRCRSCCAISARTTSNITSHRIFRRPRRRFGANCGQDERGGVLAQLNICGTGATVEQFEDVAPPPKWAGRELLGADTLDAAQDEPVVKVDPTSDQKKEQLPTYNAYSRDGDVTAPLVYVNYGAPADYEELAAMGVSVKGAIVIARYGQTWRGIKPKVAAEP